MILEVKINVEVIYIKMLVEIYFLQFNRTLIIEDIDMRNVFKLAYLKIVKNYIPVIIYSFI